MLQEPMMERLLAMRLHGMADALKVQQQDPAARELSFLDACHCWSISSGTGVRIKLWRGVCTLPNCAVTPASKRSTTARPAAWTRA